MNIADRTLPHSLDAEQSVLGAILLQNDGMIAAAEIVTQAMFFRDAHRRIFRGMQTLWDAKVAIDLTTLRNELGRTGELDEVGGPAYIAALIDGVARSSHVEHYARLIAEKASLRETIFAGNKMIAAAYEAEDSAETIVERAVPALLDIAVGHAKGDLVPIGSLFPSMLEQLEAIGRGDAQARGVATGFHDLDRELTGRGFLPGNLVIIGGRPSQGKTSIALNIAAHAASRGHATAVFSLEMTKEELWYRVMAAEARVDLQRLMNAQLLQAEYGRFSASVGTVNDWPLHLDDSEGVTVAAIRAKARRMQARHGLSLVVVDYIQLMREPGKHSNRVIELGLISSGLKRVAKELGVPFVVLSQLSRDSVKGEARRPQLSDLRDSGSLEQDADIVLLMWREEAYRDDPPPEIVGIGDVIIAKQRNGPIGCVTLVFDKQLARFENKSASQGT